ncbi:transposase family protein [candidate division CSSED10-310 bacterium]|uniref:Transposase family protein n=1 Tax=candidate division CSSED10-310 bacterium TaxID=2855610 RepID=A0ABV6Z1G0_UNCC1
MIFPPLFSHIHDPREQAKITYSLPSLSFIAILIFLCRLKARRQVKYRLHTTAAQATFDSLFGINRIPHGDTLNNTFASLKPQQLQETICRMNETLLRKKILSPSRILGTYYLVGIDGSGVFTYTSQHCPHCLTRKQGNHLQYYHPVVEAKLITPDGFAFSLMTEFIENISAGQSVQDCELKAFYRLAKRLKKRFPRLPILLTLDGLYAGGPTFSLCRRYGWKYMIVLKDKDLKTVNEEFNALRHLQTDNRFTWKTGPRNAVKQSFQWVTDIDYSDSVGKEHTLNVLECLERKQNKKGEEQCKKFKWITNLTITKKQVAHIAQEGGRNRWKLENEGFNVQKNGGYELEHAYTTNPTSAKIFYFFLQIAHIIAQLMEKGDLIKKCLATPIGSNRNIAFRILEAWRNVILTDNYIKNFRSLKLQIRFRGS